MGFNISLIGVKEEDGGKVSRAAEPYFQKNPRVEHKLLTNLEFNKGWTVILLKDDFEDETFAQYLSKELMTTSVFVKGEDTVFYRKIVSYINGSPTDEFEYLDFELLEKKGYFEKYEDEDEDLDILGDYYKHVEFEPYAAEILDKLGS